MTDAHLSSQTFGNTRRYTHFSQLTGDAQATAASIGAFNEVVVYEGDLVIGKKPDRELYFINVDGVQHISDLLTCEMELFGRAELLGTLPEPNGPRGLQHPKMQTITGNAAASGRMGHNPTMGR